MDPVWEFLLALGIYINCQIWLLFIIHRLTSIREDHQSPSEDKVIERSGTERTTSYIVGILIAAVMMVIGGTLSLIEERALELTGIFTYMSFSVILMFCWLVYCMKTSSQLIKPIFNKKFIRLGEVGSILLLILGAIAGIIYNLKIIVLTLFLAIVIFTLFRCIGKYFIEQ